MTASGTIPTATPNYTSADFAAACGLLHGLVAVPSTSRNEQAASTWLVHQMRQLGYARAYVDGAGNAVGELGEADASNVIVLLGHIDTVLGNIAVRVEETEAGPVLFGRGAVDAKGPLAAFVWAAHGLGHAWAVEHNLRLVVVGAVEEEAATSKGARFIRDRFDGVQDPRPVACIIGEPSAWRRVTLGYKGRLLVEVEARRPMAHSAGPDAGVATVPVAVWNWIDAYCAAFNAPHAKAFDQLMPSLRSFRTWTDEAMIDVAQAHMGLRLPEAFDADAFVAALSAWASAFIQESIPQEGEPIPTAEKGDATAVDATRDDVAGHTGLLEGAATRELHFGNDFSALTLRIQGYERAWRSDRQNALVRSFLAAIRAVDAEAKPGFVVKTGTSDMNVVGPAWQSPILAYGPGDSALDHTPNEHIHLDEYWRSTLVLQAALQNLARQL